ncbi:MAG: histidinol-phosphatase [Clostridia bacterium]|nr:histidinol-phosphatase [Clostridia bacterium]
MRQYLYETHLHTSQGSACGKSPGRDYPAIYRDLGYDGIFVTDHFFQGNCAAPRTGKWKDRVDAYMAGYEDAREAGCKVGLKVFFGIEQNYAGDEYLIYGVDREFLLEHEYIEAWSRQKLFDEVRAWGGVTLQAHPFRERGYIKKLHFTLEGIDGVEGLNMGNNPWEDVCALKYARKLGLPVTCGSDIHNAANAVPERLAAVALDEPVNSSLDYASYIRAGKRIRFVYPAERLEGISARLPETPWEAAGGDGQITDFRLEDYLFGDS